VKAQNKSGAESVWSSPAEVKIFAPIGVIYVDGAYGGEELGTSDKPFNTVGEAYDVAVDAERIVIQAGFYNEKLRFSKRLALEARGGTVTIGKGK